MMMAEVPELLEPVALGIALSAIVVLWTVFLVRVVGLRAFSKMTAFDFVATVATGSLIAQAATRARIDEFVQTLAAIGGVFLIQWLLAKSRQRLDWADDILTNEPVLLMDRGQFLEQAMTATRVSRSNILEKLRSAGVTDLAEVRAVVLETTGDVSIIRGSEVAEEIMEGVRRVPGE